MFLSEITTIDQLMLALARQGYGKVSAHERPEYPLNGIYALQEFTCACCGEHNTSVTIIPPGFLEHGDACLDAYINQDGTIDRWQFWTCFDDTIHRLDPATVEVGQIGPAIDDWLTRIEQEAN